MRTRCLFVALALMLSGCDAFLAPDRDNIYDEDKLKKHAELAEGVLLKVYGNLPSGINHMDVATDNAVSNANANTFRKAAIGSWSSMDDPFSVWDNAYESIAYINHFIYEVIDNVQWSSEPWQNAHYKLRLTAEARCLRAFNYIRLLEAHAGVGTSGKLLGVPMIMAPVDVNGGVFKGRDSYADCVELILKDLEFAIETLPVKYGVIPDGIEDAVAWETVYGSRFANRANGMIARMLKARILYHYATPAFNLEANVQRWRDAADAAAEVIDMHGGLAALGNDRIMYWMDELNPDILWRKNFTNSHNWETDNFPPSFFGNGRVNPSQNIVDAFPMASGLPVDAPSSGYNPSSPYSGRDPRLAAYVLYNGGEFKGAVVNTMTDRTDGIDQIAERSTRTGYYMKKHMNQGVSLTTGSVVNQRHFATLMRYTEAYLMYAESACMAYGPDEKGPHAYTAREVIGALRKTAGLGQPDTYLNGVAGKDAMLKLILNERRLELAFEGYRFWDLRRHKDMDAIAAAALGTMDAGQTSFVVEERKYQQYSIYGPIPYDECRKGLEQNNGWK